MSAQLEDRGAGAASARATVAHSSVAPLLDAKGAAALLNVPATWVLAEARADRIPHVRLGRYVRFDAAELESWWQSRRRGPWRSRVSPAEAPRTARPQPRGASKPLEVAAM
jgi:excisionase family DNA binding protein